MVLADDHSVLRRGLRTLLEEAGFTIPAEAADAPHSAAQGPCL
jgi:DNA-binding NarL/FixJ family response regulator